MFAVFFLSSWCSISTW